MPYLGNNQFQINNPDTGETKVVSGEELGQYGLSPSDLTANNGVPTGIANNIASSQTPPQSQFANSPPMQVNDTMQQLQDQAFNNPDLGQMPPSALNANAESFGGTPPGDNSSPPPPPSSGDSGNSGMGGTIASIAGTVLPMLGPEGLLAKVVLGAGGGLLTGLATGGNQEQILADTIGGAAGMGLVSELSRLIPSSVKINLANKAITAGLQKGDQALEQTGNKTGILTDELMKHFNSPQAIDTLLPAATGRDKTFLAKTLGEETAHMGGGELGELSLPKLQELKMAYAAKGSFKDPNPTPAEKLYRNMSGQMSKIIEKYAGDSYASGNNQYKSAINDELFNKSFPQKLMQRLRTGMYAYYDYQGAKSIFNSMHGGNNQQTQPPTLPFNAQ